MSRKIFISYEYESDKDFVNSIKGMVKTPENISFNTDPLGNNFYSEDAKPLKVKIKQEISKADALVCIVGRRTNSSVWVRWEIETATRLGKSIHFLRKKDDVISTMPEDLLKLSKSSMKNWYTSFLESL